MSSEKRLRISEFGSESADTFRRIVGISVQELSMQSSLGTEFGGLVKTVLGSEFGLESDRISVSTWCEDFGETIGNALRHSSCLRFAERIESRVGRSRGSEVGGRRSGVRRSEVGQEFRVKQVGLDGVR